ncbi:DNA-3-methyladenine glycosylase [Caldimonas tepidiphila]|uniref:DNA-3-methyladenine glycosylase n=1 Tax=Caldimonas tepidiphila TaxID=2315841 RepID=UPI000E5B99B9|nr:DNA-3-methyladenine glycosylase [Caldimonas tepidiphila]
MPAGHGRLRGGPGRLGQALGITRAHDGLLLDRPPFLVLPASAPAKLVAGPLIGILKAVDVPRRFWLAGSRFVSRSFR